MKLNNIMLKEKAGMNIRQFIQRGRTDFEFFCSILFGADIQPYHLEWVESYVNNKRTSITSFRGSGKSYVMAVLAPLWLMFYERDLIFLNVSPTQRQSFRIIDEMRECIRDVELLQMLVPKDNTSRWTRQEINTTTRCKVVSVPYTDNARGWHVDFLLADEAQEMKDTNLFSSVFVPMVQHKDGNICMIGTCGNEADLLAEKSLPQSGYQVFRYPILDPSTGQSIWPKKFSLKRIEEIKRDQGSIAFAREYLLELRGVAGQAIDPNCLVHAMDETMSMGKFVEPGSQVFMGVDLATSIIGDYTSISFVERTKGGTFILKWVERHRGRTVKNQGEIIADRYRLFKPSGAKIDISQIGPSIVQDLRMNYGINLTPFQFTNVSRNALFNKLINVFGEYDEKHKVVRDNNFVIPRNVKDPYTQQMSNIILNEFGSLYPAETMTGQPTFKTSSEHDDCLKEGTLIKTKKGYVAIEDIHVGDLVLTHRNRYKPVIASIKKPFDGDWYKMRYVGQVPLELSYNHPQLIHAPTYKNKRKTGKFKSRWVLPSGLKKAYYQTMVVEQLKPNEYITLYERDYYTNSKHANTLLKQITLDKSFARFLGLFLAEGNCVDIPGNYCMSLAFNIKEDRLLNFTKDYLTQLGLKVTIETRNETNCNVVKFSSKLLYYILSECYTLTREKQLPPYAQYLGLDLEGTLGGWLDGDGWYNEKRGVIIGATTSKQLGLSMRDIAVSIGRYALINQVKRKRYDVPTKDQYWVSIKEGITDWKYIHSFGDGLYGTRLRGAFSQSRIPQVVKTQFQGEVYNLQVADDESFIADGHVVHNCLVSTALAMSAATSVKKGLIYAKRY